MTPEIDFVRTTRKAVEAALGARGKDDARPAVRIRDANGAYWSRGDDGEWTPESGGSPKAHGPKEPLEVPTSVLATELPPELTSDPAPERPVDSVTGFARMVDRIRASFEDGQTSARHAEALARGRVLLDTKGRVWTVGLRGGAWFAFDGRTWHAHAKAPDPSTLVRPERKRQGCHACGHAVEGETACAACGAPPSPVLADTPPEVADGLAAFLSHAAGSMLPERIADPWVVAEARPGQAGRHHRR